MWQRSSSSLSLELPDVDEPEDEVKDIDRAFTATVDAAPPLEVDETGDSGLDEGGDGGCSGAAELALPPVRPLLARRVDVRGATHAPC